MIVNKDVAVSTRTILLVPYEPRHVPTYHQWMKDPDIQDTTASEPLSLEEEYAMQRSWRTDADKLTFIICLPLEHSHQKPATIVAGTPDSPQRMIGDINLFLSPADEDSEGLVGEIELMIAPVEARSKGYGRAALLAFLKFVGEYLGVILDEYRASVGGVRNGLKGEDGKMNLLQLRVKIGQQNETSIRLFQSTGFKKISEEPNYFGEVELVFDGFFTKDKVDGLLEKWPALDYLELYYDRKTNH